MNKAIFESQLLPDGHLSCPKEFIQKRNARFKVVVIFENTETEVSERNIELSAIADNSTDFLSKEELDYYFNLEEL